MAFLDELKEKAGDLGRAGVAKSKQLAEITRLKVGNAMEEDTIKKAYTEIGRLYYAERGLAPEAAYVSLCEKITAAMTNIEENKLQIARVKAEGKDFPEEEEPFADVQVPPEEATPADFADLTADEEDAEKE